MPSNVTVLIIDDGPSEGFAGFMAADGIRANAKHPNDVSPDDVQSADVIVIDQFLNTWRFDPESPATTRPVGGLAVAAVLRSQLEPKPTPIVIFTGGLAQLGSHIPSAVREAGLADEYNVEWVIDRTDRGLFDAVKSFAEAVRSMPSVWDEPREVDTQLLGWFDLRSKTWRDEALLDIEQCRPITGGVAAHTSGAAFLRWFLHRILPYPSFLLDARRAAFRLSLQLDEFRRLTESPDSELSSLIDDAAYTGALATFQGMRWWRAGLDEILQSSDEWVAGEIGHAAALGALAGRELRSLDPARYRLPVDGDLYTLDPAPRDEVVRIVPEPWPVYADDAFALVEDLLEDERLLFWRTRVEG